jgi:L-asparaginase/Glu-tRNA(Gln) amidotransferase subunit D
MKSTVVVVSTGGTIAMRPEAGTGKLVPLVSGDELVEMIGWMEAPPVEKARIVLQLALDTGLDARATLAAECS